MTSAENSVSEPPNLKMFRGKIPPQPLPSALARDNAPSPPPRQLAMLATALNTFCKLFQ